MLNHRSKSGKQRRGKHVYMTWKDVKAKFGPQANDVRERKYELERNRDPKDSSPPWWAPHPELKDDKDWRHEATTHTIAWINVQNLSYRYLCTH